MEQYWAVGQTWTGREHRIRADIEGLDHGAFLPTCERRTVRRGLLDVRERPLLPGYVMFRTDAKGWGDVAAVDGVRVIANDEVAGRVLDKEIARLIFAHATGAGNEFAVVSAGRPAPSKQARRGRKPRRGKRIRKRTAP